MPRKSFHKILAYICIALGVAAWLHFFALYEFFKSRWDLGAWDVDPWRMLEANTTTLFYAYLLLFVGLVSGAFLLILCQKSDIQLSKSN